MLTQMKYNCLNGARTSKIHQDRPAHDKQVKYYGVQGQLQLRKGHKQKLSSEGEFNLN